jgi:hypothetical protein
MSGNNNFNFPDYISEERSIDYESEGEINQEDEEEEEEKERSCTIDDIKSINI